MIFSSLQYLLFLPLVAILYWRTRGTARLVITVVASYIFYMSWLPIYGILLVTMTTANWALGLAMEAARQKRSSLLKPLLAIGLLGNLGCLCYYKYTNFFLSNICHGLSSLFQLAGSTTPPAIADWTSLNILLPLGISFFVFEFVHYVVDVYKGDKPIRSWLEFAAFAAFFPSQIAGPIKRFQDFMHYLRQPLPWSAQLLNEGGALIVQGLFKKVAIADPINCIIASSFAPHAVLSAADAWVASIGFVIQVYCDFSGYTDIGRGSALLLGIRLPENFNLPYLAEDLADFWRRWHMSLSFWLRDYVYIPLGGSRSGSLGNARNLFLTMVACGLWHGAAWHYVIFGCLQGAGLIVHRWWRDLWRAIPALNEASARWYARAAGVAMTMLFITITYTLFRAPDVPTGLNVLSSWFGTDWNCSLWLAVMKSGVLVFLAVYASFWLITEALKRRLPPLTSSASPAEQPYVVPRLVYPPALRFASWTAALFLIVAARPTVATPFVYFQF